MTLANPSAPRKMTTAKRVSNNRTAAGAVVAGSANGRRTADNSTEREFRSRSERIAFLPVTGRRQASNAAFVHPSAEVSPDAALGEGCRVWGWARIREG